MSEASLSLTVHLILPANSTREEEEEAVSQLRRELLETDVKSVEIEMGLSAPDGAKGLPAGLDTLLITLAGSGSILGAVLNTVAGWARNMKGTATVKYNGNEFTFTNLSSEDQHALVAQCLARLSTEEG